MLTLKQEQQRRRFLRYQNANVEFAPATIEILPDGRMTMQETAKYLGIKYSTLRVKHIRGDAPPSVKIGTRVFFFKREVDKWIRSQCGK